MGGWVGYLVGGWIGWVGGWVGRFWGIGWVGGFWVGGLGGGFRVGGLDGWMGGCVAQNSNCIPIAIESISQCVIDRRDTGQ